MLNMPLYSNILGSKKGDDKPQLGPKQNTANAGLKFLQDHLQSKRRAQQNQQTHKTPNKPFESASDTSKSNQIILERSLHSTENDWDPEDEYDPRAPNSYEILLDEHIKSLEEQRKMKVTFADEIKVVATKKKLDLTLLDAIDKLDHETDCDIKEDKKIKGTSIAPPLAISSVNNAKNSTRVVLLQNMVGPGEVDDSLEAETKEECGKYGHVLRCLIYEIPNKSVPDDEAVRIFVEFDRVESASKAFRDLDGRYFGGRVVKASFYDVEKFHAYELGLPVIK